MKSGQFIAVLALAGVCITISLIGLGCASKSTTNRSKAMDVYVQGLDAYRRGDKAAAIADLERASQLNPDLRMPHSVLGDIYFSGGNLERALVQYKEMVRLDPYAAVNHYRLGLTYQLMHKLQDSAAAYLRALQLDPRDPKTNMNLGLVYLALNQEEDAMKYLRRATELAPNSAEAWANYGAILDIRGKLPEAESAYKHSLEIDGTQNSTILNLGFNLIEQGRAGEAVSVMQQALKNDNSIVIRKRYADALLMAKQYDAAIEQYDLCLRQNPSFYQAMSDKGIALIRKYHDGMELDDDMRKAAIDVWKQSLALNPKQPRIEAQLRQWQETKLFGK
jgi:tetratricopeptide (TPR) repeat protein